MSQQQNQQDEQSFLAAEIYEKIVNLCEMAEINGPPCLTEDDLTFLRWCMNIKQQ